MKRINKYLLIALLFLSACQKKDRFLYQSTNNQLMNNINDNLPYEVDINDDLYGAGLCYNDEQAKEIVDLYTNIIIGEEIDEPLDYENQYSISFYFDDDFYDSTFYDDITSIYDNDGNVKYYKTINSSELLSLIKERINDSFHPDLEYVDILEFEGLQVKQGLCEMDEQGNYSIELQLNNTSQTPYSITLKPMVNGHEIHSYQHFICGGENETGYYVSIPTETLKLFGVNVINNIKYTIEVYSVNEETLDEIELLYTSKEMIIELSNENENILKADLIYSNDDVNVYLKLSEHDMYSCLNLYFENFNNKNIVFSINEVSINDDAIDTSSYGDVYSITLNGISDKFALLPLNNYEYNEETNEVKKIEINGLSITFDLTIDGKTSSDTVEIK